MPTYETLYGGVTRRTDAKEHYHERWERAAGARLELAVYVPASEHLTHMIAAGSGIVGSPAAHESRKVVIHYEGNLFGAENMQTFEQKVHHAAGRHVCAYPTIATAVVDEDQLHRVGSYDVATDSIDVEDQAAVDAWTGS